jgi:hypothetical protein
MNNQTKPRKWLVEGDPVVIDGYEHDSLRQELDECLMMLRRVGGAICVGTPQGTLMMGAIRERLDPNGEFFETTGFVFQWVPSIPSARRVEPAPDPEDEPDPDPDPVPDPPELVEAA